MTRSMKVRLRIYEVLSFPGHVWIWLCAWLVGGHYIVGAAAASYVKTVETADRAGKEMR